MFVNLSNHESKNWQKKQIEKAEKYGEIIDMAFPEITGSTSIEEIDIFVKEYYEKLSKMSFDAILLVGEYSFVYSLIKLLLKEHKNVFSIKSDFKLSHYVDKDGICKREIKNDFIDFVRYEIYDGKISKMNNHNNILLNCSMNYPFSSWGSDMKNKIREYDKVGDLIIEPLDMENKEKRQRQIESYISEIDKINPKSVILDGQFFTFFALAELLDRKGYDIYVKCSNRVTKERIDESGNSVKQSIYKFIQFRKINNK